MVKLKDMAFILGKTAIAMKANGLTHLSMDKGPTFSLMVINTRASITKENRTVKVFTDGQTARAIKERLLKVKRRVRVHGARQMTLCPIATKVSLRTI